VANFPADLSLSSSTPLIVEFIQTQPMWLWIVSFIGLGALLALTPCVLPMMPIVSAMVLGKTSVQVASLSATQALLRSSVYVLGMCLSYTALGVAAGLSGVGLGAYLQTPWVLITFSALMLVMAGAQFGWYALRLPAFLQALLSTKRTENTVSKRGYLSLLAMGALAALIVSPCVTPPLAGVLLFISQTKDAFKGGLALFSLSLGMGLPLLVIAVAGTSILPKSGAWMQSVSHAFGVMLLGVAIWIVQSLLSAIVFMLLGAVLCFVAALYCWKSIFQAEQLIGNSGHFWKEWFKRLPIMGLIATAGALIGAAFMSYQYQATITHNTSLVETAPELQFETLSSSALSDLLNDVTSNRNTLPYIVDVYADWCVSCLEFEQLTLRDPAVKQALAGFKCVRVDVTNNTVDDQTLLKKLGVFGPPAILFYSSKAKPLPDNTRLIGFQSAAQFLLHLKNIKTIAQKP
jgi:thioredoxin:protein disulfide reductase